MADSTTPAYAFVQPEVGGSTDTWGTKLNSDLLAIENELLRYRISFNSPAVGATTTLDLALARAFEFTVNQITTIAFTNVPSASFFTRWIVKVTNGGLFAVTWPGSVVWDEGTAPVMPAAGVIWLEFWTLDNATTVYGRVNYVPTDAALNPRASVYNSATQIGDSLTLAFNTERYDVGTMHDNAVNNSRLTVPAGQGGLWMIAARVRYDTEGAFAVPAQVLLSARKNGATTMATVEQIVSDAGETGSIALVIHEELVAGDYVELLLTLPSASSFALAGVAEIAFEMVRVR